MSLDVSITATIEAEVFSANITHNLREMAQAAGIYDVVWRPEESGVTHAYQLIEPLKLAISKMKEQPNIFKQFDAPNGWGLYDNFVPWLERYLEKCLEFPGGKITASR